MKESILKKIDWLILPAIGVAVCILLWSLIAGKEVRTEAVDDFGDKVVKVERVGLSADLPSPAETWVKSKPYIVEPFAKRGELDQGILSFTWLSLKLVAQGYLIALLVGTPIGFSSVCRRRSPKCLTRSFKSCVRCRLWRGCR